MSNRFLASIPAEVDQPVRLHYGPLGMSLNLKVRMYSWLEALCLQGIEMIVKVLPSVCALCGQSFILRHGAKVSKSDALVLIGRCFKVVWFFFLNEQPGFVCLQNCHCEVN